MRIRGMHVPAPLAEVLFGRGRLLSFGLAFVGALFAVLAEGFKGIATFVIVVLVLLVAELWRESERLTDERNEARTAGQRTISQLDQEIERTRLLAARDDQAHRLERDVAWLKGSFRLKRLAHLAC